MAGIVAGLVLAASMLGINGQPGLAALLSGPSIITLIKVFILRKSDKSDAAAAAEASKAAVRNLAP
ncbi:hypothetical protein ACFLIM_25090 [Nonomuraea sp. M3C6]|uniref:Uncharacterized protein n=1 Tax=Nonomuraea marmarensis TaxID=3351344 RepID=A0ABW7AGJ7_9ACTN